MGSELSRDYVSNSLVARTLVGLLLAPSGELIPWGATGLGAEANLCAPECSAPVPGEAAGHWEHRAVWRSPNILPGCALGWGLCSHILQLWGCSSLGSVGAGVQHWLVECEGVPRLHDALQPH